MKQRKIMTLVLVLLMVLALFSVAALADEEEIASEEIVEETSSNALVLTTALTATAASGTDWSLDDDGLLTISSDAGMDNWRDVLDTYKTEVTSAVIGDNVTYITGSAFDGCSNLTAVTIGSNVKTIGDYAFRRTALTTVSLPDSVESIGKYAFCYCTALTTVTFGEKSGLVSIGNNAFYYCTALTTIVIPDSVTSIGASTFQYCTSLSSITIPNSVTTIGYSAFQYCTSLTSITIPDSVSTITDSLFCGCTSLTSVTIKASVSSIGNNAFQGCTSLASITIPASVTTIGNNAFQGCTSLTSITIPASVTTIGDYAFDGCTGLTIVTFVSSSGLTTIGNNTFQDCTSLASITIPDGIETIKSYAFRGCTSLTSVTIPASVTSIESYAFRGCTSLTSIAIPASVTTIGNYAFSGCTNLQSVSFGAGSQLTTIGNCAFQESGLTEIVIPDTVTSLGGIAFSDCTSLKTVTIGSGITIIYGYTFQNCTSLDSVTIPANVKKVKGYAFTGCTGLTAVTIEACDTTYENTSFDNTAVINQTAHTWDEGEVTAATETTDKKILYTCTVCGTEKTETIHTWGETVYTWAVDYSTCAASRTCSLCNETETAEVTASSEQTKDPTCTEKGVIAYTATFDGYDWADTQIKTEEIAAIGHTWGETVYTWAVDYSTCAASRTCSLCNETETAEVTASSEQTQNPACTDKGEMTYTAAFDGCDWADTQTMTAEIPVNGHSWSIVWTLSDDCAEATVSFACANCNFTGSATVSGNSITSEITTEPDCTTAGIRTYAVIVEFEGETYEGTIDRVEAATGHSWDETQYTWAEDNSTCTATHTCTACNETETAEVDASSEQTKDPTCTDKGEMTYTVAFDGYDWADTQTTTAEIPSAGHTYGEPVFAWAEDYSSATAAFTCVVEDDTVEVDCTVTSVTTAATCTADGETVYTASVTFGGEAYTEQRTETIPATGHSFGAWETITSPICEDVGNEQRVCTICGYTETQGVDATGHNWETEYTIDKEPTCATEGSQSIHCKNCNAVKVSEVIPATGHSYEAEVVAATYTAKGYTVYTCSACGDSYVGDYTAILTIDVTDESIEIRPVLETLTTVPEGLTGLYSTVDSLSSELLSRVTVSKGYTTENAAVYDVKLQFRVDGGEWMDATEDNFPVGGITVKLPYPNGTDSSYDFAVVHMFTVTSDRLNITAGGTESPAVTKGEDGLAVTLNGLSPVAIAWKEADTGNETEATATQTATVTASTIPPTGDGANPKLWAVLTAVCAVGLGAALLLGRKERTER